jgi:16S rRNA (adenine1518-N6/adenine1519-N6)-dimethyltransferase
VQGHRARKRFGQNFLVEAHFINRIVEAVDPQTADTVVEIGPGLGALTSPLLLRLDHLHVIEIDRDLAQRLREHDHAARLTIHEQDALTFDFATLPAPMKIVGNLPYNISTPLLFHIASNASRVRHITVMLQKEVVDRMTAQPAAPEYGRLSVMLQATFLVKRLFVVPPGAFRPIPSVDSAVAQLTPLATPKVPTAQMQAFSTLVTAAFGQRRKTLRNALKGIVNEEGFSRARIDASGRGEELSVDDFVRLLDACAQSVADATRDPAR